MGRKPTCLCGGCDLCIRRERMRAYYRMPGVADKVRARARRYRQANLELVREKDRARGFRGTPEKTKARNAARTVARQPCEVCGAEFAERHHPDYERPTDVRFLCKEHHAVEHRMVA